MEWETKIFFVNVHETTQMKDPPSIANYNL